MEELYEKLRPHTNKIVWIILLIGLGIWFSNEYLTTKRLVREQASILYSNLMEQYKGPITNTDPSKKESLEELQRFKSELTRLIKDYEGTEYSKFGQLLEAAMNLGKSDSSKINDLNSFSKDAKLGELAEKPFERIEQEISQLIYAKTLLISDDQKKVEEGRQKLKDLINTSDIVPVEASVSYLLSLPSEGLANFERFKEIDELVKRKPELHDDLEQELAKYGFYLAKN
jgi:predicted negative regulator of RcsB-dependent stress response